MESWVGKTLGKVQIESLVGRGGVAEVYLGTHTTLERKVAVKILRNLNEENTDALDRFKREARVIARLRHPNIVQVHDFDTIDNNPYLVMEFVEGPSLSKYLNHLHKNKGRLPLHQVIRMLRAVASALQYAHHNGLVHRDVKPGNILLTSPSTLITIGKPLPEDFEPILTDFGLVRMMDGHRQTTTGHIAGTPAYMSPEQSRGEATDGRTDVYALGVVLYEMLAGDIPFDGESTVSILLKQVTEPPPPIPGISPLVQIVLDRALAKNVKDRFQTPLELADAFEAAAELRPEAATMQFNELATILPTDMPSQGLPAPERESPSSLGAPTKAEPPAKLPVRWLYIGVPALVVLALGGFFWINNAPSAPPATATAMVLPSATYASTITFTLPPISPTLTFTPSLPAGPVGVLHFQNGKGLVDQAALSTLGMPLPPPASQYEIWLVGGDNRLSLGLLEVDAQGRGKISFSEPAAANLIARFDTMEITIEPKPDDDLASSGLIAFSFTLPQEGLTHVRYLLSTFPRTPDKGSLIQGLYSSMQQIEALAKDMQIAAQSGDEKTLEQKAELALNLLVGAQSPDYKDWNGDGKKEPRNSYGLSLNGGNFGYIQAVYAEAEVAISSPNATAYMIDNGKLVKICAQNLTGWTPELRTLLLGILDPASESSRSESIDKLVTLAGKMLNGFDVDNNGKVDPIAGECGAQTAYERTYAMADMPIMPASISYQLTEVANSTAFPGTKPSGDGNGSTAVPNTPKPKPTQKPHPTDRPPPPQKEKTKPVKPNK